MVYLLGFLGPSKILQLIGLIGLKRHVGTSPGGRISLTKARIVYSMDKVFNMQNYVTIGVNEMFKM